MLLPGSCSLMGLDYFVPGSSQSELWISMLEKAYMKEGSSCILNDWLKVCSFRLFYLVNYPDLRGFDPDPDPNLVNTKN